jgi:hypothetical protein
MNDELDGEYESASQSQIVSERVRKGQQGERAEYASERARQRGSKR